jgi:hypothetical protein
MRGRQDLWGGANPSNAFRGRHWVECMNSSERELCARRCRARQQSSGDSREKLRRSEFNERGLPSVDDSYPWRTLRPYTFACSFTPPGGDSATERRLQGFIVT